MQDSPTLLHWEAEKVKLIIFNFAYTYLQINLYSCNNGFGCLKPYSSSGWKGPLKIVSCSPLPKQCQLQQLDWDCVQLSIELIQNMLISCTKVGKGSSADLGVGKQTITMMLDSSFPWIPPSSLPLHCHPGLICADHRCPQYEWKLPSSPLPCKWLYRWASVPQEWTVGLEIQDYPQDASAVSSISI